MKKWPGVSCLKSDVVALVTLLVGIVFAVSVMFFFDAGDTERDTESKDSLYVSRFKKNRFHRDSVGGNSESDRYYKVEERRVEFFPFDPNTADSTDFLRLGLQPWQVRNIYKYRARGGIYRKPEDFARLYGLTVGQYNALKPYIRISSDYLPASSMLKDSARRRDTLRFPTKLTASERILLNAADTTILKRVPGIGSGYAAAIVRYREQLGGFVSLDQLCEIDGFPATAKQYFVLDKAETRKLNINTLPLSLLRKHPYMGFHRAKAIVDYRNEKGKIGSLIELKLSRDFTPEAIERLLPYIEN